jgi:small acid-soluble spore protein F (minor alpha/beta-type SASP)
MKKKKKADPMEPMKRAIARELGLEDIIVRDGWGGLTAAQSGRIGGIMASRMGEKKQEVRENHEAGLSEDGRNLRPTDG